MLIFINSTATTQTVTPTVINATGTAKNLFVKEICLTGHSI